MNKVYKVIWNKVKHCYVVVSEIAKRNGKSVTMKSQSGKTIAAALTVFALCLGMTGVVSAAKNTEGTGMGVAIGAGSVATDDAAVAVGINSKAEYSSSVAIGNEATAEEGFSIAIGKKSTASKNGAIAMGNESKATDSAAVAIGGGSEADLSGTAIGYGTLASGYSTAIGLQSKTTGFGDIALGYIAKSSGMGSTAIGGEAAANADHAIAVGSYAKAKGLSSTAVGNAANATVEGAMALGVSAQGTGKYSTAIGKEATATQEGAMAFGVSAQGTGKYSTAIGGEAAANADHAIAVGSSAKAKGLSSTAIGEAANATQEGAIAFGGSANGAGTYSIAIGNTAAATASGAIAFGRLAKGMGVFSTAIGTSAQASGQSSVAIGPQSIASESSALAFGIKANASGQSAMAIGPRSQASAKSAVALGNKSIANIGGGVAIGSDSKTNVDAGITGYDPSGAYATDSDELLKKGTPWRSTLAAVSVGNSEKGYTRQITNVAAGTLDTDAVNVAQLKALNEKVDNSVLSSGKNITVHTTTDANGVKKNTIDLNDNITFGSDAAPDKEVKVDGTKGQVVIGDAAKGSGLVIGNQEVTTTSGKKETGKFMTGLSNTTWDKDNIVADRAATEGQLKEVTNSLKNISDTIGGGTRDFGGDDRNVSVKLGETMNLKGGADVTNLSDGNIGVVTNSNKDGFDIKLSKDIKGLNNIEVNHKITIGTGDNQTIIEGNTVNTGSITTGNTTMNNNGLTVKNEDPSKNITIQNNNVNMGGNVITNIGEGTNPTDAINKNQFDREISQINNGMGQVNNRISNLDNRVDRVGAGAAALAALHPLDFDPTSRWEVSAGVGNYRGANAVAVGAFYRPNYDTMISLGSSYGGGENMVNAGVTFRIGEGTTKVYSLQDALAREVDSLRSLVDEQNRKLESQSKQLTAQNNKIESQSEQLAAQNNKLEAQNSKIEAQSRQLESQGKQLQEQSRQIAQLMKDVAELKK
ncbi:MAG: ESPR-type extended signal peptide-containing protein [Megasphaera massiliensis]|uniref:ESPR-type extended signal peptide-containing protein n=1 Tax=Megasphaera massiliensis TaxID=1232428 RepID=UPI002E7A653E|nr:ESPR-type extended signal peptide-containing protein [Megasphaera massiliensis]MEE0657560.1 ESPR-type extended signal peptide-containing protein [Megasphaera massiliensis]